MSIRVRDLLMGTLGELSHEPTRKRIRAELGGGTAGEALTISAAGREAAAFRPAVDALAGYLVLDFAAFDAWYEEDERNYGPPARPVPPDRHRAQLAPRAGRAGRRGVVLAESSAPSAEGEPDIAWTYPAPLLERPVTPWSLR